jgi:hypothetical protein
MQCLPDKTVDVLLDYYTKCGIGDDVQNAIKDLSNVGAPLEGQYGQPRDLGAITEVTLETK